MFYHDVRALVNTFIRHNEKVEHIQYDDFYEVKEIGAGGYGTVYTAKYKKFSEVKGERMRSQTVVLKRFKSLDETPELFISEVSNNC